MSQVEAGHQHAGCDETRIERHEIAQRSAQQQRTHDQYQGQGDLQHDEAATDHHAFATVAGAARTGLHRVARIGVGDAKGRGQAEQHTRQTSEQRHEAEHAPSRRQVDEHATRAVGVEKGDEAAAEPLREEPPPRAPHAASNRLSLSICRTSRPREAPMASRTATSRERAAARANIRFARLAQAISRTTAVTPSRTHSGVE